MSLQNPCESNPLTQKIDCELEVLTPVHIGSGEVWRHYLDFFLSGRKVWILNHSRLYEALAEIPATADKTAIDKYSDLISQNRTREVEQYIQQEQIDFETVAKWQFEYPRSEPANEIRPLVRTGLGRTIIPGSSIKGAMRSAIFNYLYKGEKKQGKDRRIDTAILGAFERAITRYIRPSDIELADSELVNIALFNLYKTGWEWESDYKTDKLLSLEVFPPGAKGVFRLAIDQGFLQLVNNRNPEIVHRNTKHIIRKENPAQHLFYLINQYTFQHLEKEIAFFEAFPQAEDCQMVIEELRRLCRLTTDNPDSCILRLAFGSGFHAITGDWQYADHAKTGLWKRGRDEGKLKYKSRKLVNEDKVLPMGFVKISLPKGTPRIKLWKVLEVQEQKKSETKVEILEKAPVQTSVAVNPIDYPDVNQDTVLSVEVLRVSKPFCKVKLLVNNYPFDPEVDMSGVKKAKLHTGQVVKALINSRDSRGMIKVVQFLH